MSMQPEKTNAPKVYDDGRTIQSFKDETDVNKILSRHARNKTMSHIAQFGGEYGDFSDMPDLLEAHKRLQRGTDIFDKLPGETRREFDQDPAKFFAFVNDPGRTQDDLKRVLPALAKPGDQMPTVRRTAANARPDPAPAPETPATPPETPSDSA